MTCFWDTMHFYGFTSVVFPLKSSVNTFECSELLSITEIFVGLDCSLHVVVEKGVVEGRKLADLVRRWSIDAATFQICRLSITVLITHSKKNKLLWMNCCTCHSETTYPSISYQLL